MTDRIVTPEANSPDQNAPFIGRQVALSSIRGIGEDQHLIVDFDQTLFLANSNQRFIGMVKPYFFGFILFKVLEFLHAWSWFAKGEGQTLARDSFHVWAITIFFPWTWLIWRAKAKRMATVWTNQEVADVLKDRKSEFNVLCSTGFGPVVRPVLKHMDLKFGEVVCRGLFSGFGPRSLNISSRISKVIGEDYLKESALVTSSATTADLLAHVKIPLRTEWPSPEVRFVNSHYMPLYYLVKIKLMDIGRIYREVVYVDVLLLYFAFSWTSPLPIINALWASCFFLSLLLIYEIGYMENDEVAFRLESDPVFADDFEEQGDAIDYIEPWFWGSAVALIGASFLLQIDALTELGITSGSLLSNFGTVVSTYFDTFFTPSQLTIAGTWMLLMVSMRYVYMFYNYTDKMTRTWIYPVMQSYKTFALMFYSSISLVGAIALFSQVACRSFAYFLYRWGRKDWPGSELYLTKFLFFLTCLAIFIPASNKNYSELLTMQTLVITLWISSRAIKPLIRFVRGVRHVSNDEWTRIT